MSFIQNKCARQTCNWMVAASALAVLAACQPEEKKAAPEIRPVRVVTVESVNSSDSVMLTGRVQAESEVNLAFRIDGRMISRAVSVGDAPRPGPDTVAREMRTPTAGLVVALLRGSLLPEPVRLPDLDLTDQAGRRFGREALTGHWTIVFFGFTSCPDVCPTTVIDSSDWLEALGPDADRLNVVLISVDPERDTPAVLADYLSNFDPRIVGLTGSLSEVQKAAAGFRAMFEKLPQDGDYTMNHTAGVFLHHADGRFASIIDFHEDRRFAIPKIRRILT